MKKILISLCMLLITLPAIANLMKSSGNSVSFQEFFDSKKEGYIMSDWINKHDKLSTNMSMQAGYDKNLERLYVSLKTVNTNNQIPNIENKKVSYQIDRFAIDCPGKKFGILETKVYDQNNQLITTLNNKVNHMLTMQSYAKPSTNIEKIGSILGNYACNSQYSSYIFKWLETNNKLSPNMTYKGGYDKSVYADIKTINRNNQIKNVNNQKVSYQIDRFCINCKSNSIFIMNTTFYNSSNVQIAKYSHDYNEISLNDSSNMAILGKMMASKICPIYGPIAEKHYQQTIKNMQIESERMYPKKK